MQSSKFFLIDRHAERNLVFLQWLVEALGLRGPPWGERALYPDLRTQAYMVRQAPRPLYLWSQSARQPGPACSSACWPGVTFDL